MTKKKKDDLGSQFKKYFEEYDVENEKFIPQYNAHPIFVIIGRNGKLKGVCRKIESVLALCQIYFGKNTEAEFSKSILEEKYLIGDEIKLFRKNGKRWIGKIIVEYIYEEIEDEIGEELDD